MSGSRPRDAWPRPLGWLGALWALGSALLLTQLLAGISRVAWIERTATAVVDPGLIARLGGAARRLGVVRPVRLLDAGSLRVPVTWELTTACILVPRQMSGWPIDRQNAVMLHEMAHIRRHDSRFQVLAYLMVALHWFNPLAWYALHRMRAERELACDDAVLMSGVRASDYAAHLLDIARSCKTSRRQLVAAVALVWPSQLAARVRAILDPTIERRSPDWRTSVSIAFAALVLAAPLAAIQPVQALPPTVAERTASSPTRSGTEPVAGRAAQPAEPTASSPTPAPQAARPSLEQLIQMRIHGVSPEYIDGMRAILGRSPDVDELVQFRIHGVTAELVQEMRHAFGADLEMDDVVQARIHGTSPEYAREMSALLGHDLDLDRLVQFRIHGVTPAYVSAMRDSFGDVSANDLVQGRIHGVSAEFAAAMRELVHGDLDFDDLEQMRIHGVTTDLVKRLRDAGYDDLTAKELVDIRIHGTERMMLRRKGQGR